MCLAGTRETVQARQTGTRTEPRPAPHHDHTPLRSPDHGAAPHDHGAAPHDHTTGDASGRAGVSRRALLGAGLGAALFAALPAAPAEARRVPARRMVDLTHVFADDMPTWGPEKPGREVLVELGDGELGFADQRWTFTEHMGTHMDAPGHILGGARMSPDMRLEELLAPVVVIDVSARVPDDPNTVVTVDDVIAFERRHGRIPRGAAVFMNSGWADRWPQGDLAYRGDEEWPYNFPGFSAEACDFLIRQRDIVGVGVDTLSTDPGDSTDFPAHVVLGEADRWGIENLANLDQMPPRGATVVVGLVPWQNGSGGPCRVFAFR